MKGKKAQAQRLQAHMDLFTKHFLRSASRGQAPDSLSEYLQTENFLLEEFYKKFLPSLEEYWGSELELNFQGPRSPWKFGAMMSLESDDPRHAGVQFFFFEKKFPRYPTMPGRKVGLIYREGLPAVLVWEEPDLLGPTRYAKGDATLPDAYYQPHLNCFFWSDCSFHAVKQKKGEAIFQAVNRKLRNMTQRMEEIIDNLD